MEVILWLKGKNPELGFQRFILLIYLAEKFHLNKFCRPIVGDSYVVTDYGPTGMTVHDILMCGFLPKRKVNLDLLS